MPLSPLIPPRIRLCRRQTVSLLHRSWAYRLAANAGLQSVESTALEIPTVFADFDDFWRPFMLGAGPAPGYCVSLPAEAREKLRKKLSDDLPRQDNGAITLNARAWALKAIARLNL